MISKDTIKEFVEAQTKELKDSGWFASGVKDAHKQKLIEAAAKGFRAIGVKVEGEE